jgi:hypothetical protein
MSLPVSLPESLSKKACPRELAGERECLPEKACPWEPAREHRRERHPMSLPVSLLVSLPVVATAAVITVVTVIGIAL